MAVVAPRGELEAREGIDAHRVGIDAAHLAAGDRRAAGLEQRAHALAEPRQVGVGDGAANREADRLRRPGGHLG